MGVYNVGLALGNVSAAAVCAASGLGFKITNDWQWKTPIICQIPLGLLLGVGVMMFPESPRWLLTKGREESARRSFGKFYKLDPHSPAITAQVVDVQTYIELEKVQGATTSWTEIYHKNDIRRTLVSAMILVGLAITGVQFVSHTPLSSSARPVSRTPTSSMSSSARAFSLVLSPDLSSSNTVVDALACCWGTP